MLFGIFCLFSNILSVNSEDTFQMPHSVASDICLHCLPLSLKNDECLICANAYSCVIKEDFIIWMIFHMYSLLPVPTLYQLIGQC